MKTLNLKYYCLFFLGLGLFVKLLALVKFANAASEIAAFPKQNLIMPEFFVYDLVFR